MSPQQRSMDTMAIAFGAVSPIGEGDGALSPLVENTATYSRVRADPLLIEARLRHPAAARVADLTRDAWSAEHLLQRAMRDCLIGLSEVRPAWRSERIGVAVGTSSGGMPATEQAITELFAGRMPDERLLRSATYGAPLNSILMSLAQPVTRSVNVLAACASSTFALGFGHLWLTENVCDVVLAGGYDALSVFVAAGFCALSAVTATFPRPFHLNRDGLAPGEGAALVALVRAEHAPDMRPALFFLGGFGASTDARHITAPDPTGIGTVAAVRQALQRANADVTAIDLVSVHGTGTAYNDAAEAKALHTLLGAAVDHVPVHAMKGETGHMFGAAGVLETLTIGRALREGLAPASVCNGPIDPNANVKILNTTRPAQMGAALKMSAAFGGANAALLVRAKPDGQARATAKRCAGVVTETVVAYPGRSLASLAELLGVRLERLSRIDAMTRLALEAVALLASRVGQALIEKAGLIVGHDVATASTNEIFYRRLLEKGFCAAEPRRFPATSPNACAGEIAIFFRMKEMTLAIGGQPGQPSGARQLAVDLLAASWLEAAVVVDVTADGSSFVDALRHTFNQSGLTGRAEACLLLPCAC